MQTARRLTSNSIAQPNLRVHDSELLARPRHSQPLQPSAVRYSSAVKTVSVSGVLVVAAVAATVAAATVAA